MSRTPPIRTQVIRQSINNLDIRRHRERTGKFAADSGGEGTADIRASAIEHVLAPRGALGCIAEFESEEVVAILTQLIHRTRGGVGTAQVVVNTGEAARWRMGGRD